MRCRDSPGPLQAFWRLSSHGHDASVGYQPGEWDISTEEKPQEYMNSQRAHSLVGVAQHSLQQVRTAPDKDCMPDALRGPSLDDLDCPSINH